MKKNSSKTPNVLVTNQIECSIVEQSSVKSVTTTHSSLKVMYVSLSENDGKVPVKILRDTGATQPLLVEGILSLSDSTATGTSVQIHGIELGVMSVPLHVIYLSSDLI